MNNGYAVVHFLADIFQPVNKNTLKMVDHSERIYLYAVT